MKTLKILAILAIFIPAFAIAQTATLRVEPVETTSTGIKEDDPGVTSGGVEEPDFGVTSAEPETTGIEHEDIGITGDDEESRADSFFDVFTEIEVDSMNESGEKGGTEDINIGVGEMKSEVGGDGEDIGAPSSGRATYDSFFDIFVDIGGEGTQAAIDAFIKLGDIKGESTDEAMEDDEAGEITFGDGETGARPSKPREIVVVGSKVKEVVRSGNVEVRGWDPEKKEMTIGPDDVEKPEDFLDFVGALTLSDENIEEVSFNFENIKMEYDQPAKLFGFLQD